MLALRRALPTYYLVDAFFYANAIVFFFFTALRGLLLIRKDCFVAQHKPVL